MKENLGVYYSQTSHFQGQQFDKLCGLIPDYINPTQVKTILDIGCGNGQRTINLLSFFPNCSKIIAIDPDAEMINTAKSQYHHHKIEYCRLKAEDLHLLNSEDSPFDLVISNWAVHWVENKQQMIQNIQDLLKPNGLFMMSTCEKLPEILTDIDVFMRDELKNSRVLANPFHYLKANQWRHLFDDQFWAIRCEYKTTVLHDENNAYQYLKHWFAASTGKFAYNKQLEELNPLSVDTLLHFLEKKYKHPTVSGGLSFFENTLFMVFTRK